MTIEHAPGERPATTPDLVEIYRRIDTRLRWYGYHRHRVARIDISRDRIRVAIVDADGWPALVATIDDRDCRFEPTALGHALLMYRPRAA